MTSTIDCVSSPRYFYATYLLTYVHKVYETNIITNMTLSPLVILPKEYSGQHPLG